MSQNQGQTTFFSKAKPSPAPLHGAAAKKNVVCP
jgi:hypothetical protein